MSDFLKCLICYNLAGLDSLRSLVCFLETCTQTIEPVAFGTLRDCFERFSYKTFEALYYSLSESLDLEPIVELSLLGKINLVDGSIFKMSQRADWAEYRTHKNGFKLHLSWNLNEMKACALSIKKANESEREELKKLLVQGTTYVCDRGYLGFDLFKTIKGQGAHFIMRIRKNMKSEVLESYTVENNFKRYSDEKVYFINDPDKESYRLIRFKHGKQWFYILTDRFDIKTEDIILLYAFRWQVELIFRFFKRTMEGLHVLNETENGVLIQFYMSQIAYLLMLSLKQKARKFCGIGIEKVDFNDLLDNPVHNFGKIIKGSWKLSKQWLIKLRAYLNYEYCDKLLRELAT